MPEIDPATVLNEVDFPGNMAVYENLRGALTGDVMVGFAGAGVSCPLFPTWTSLLASLLRQAIDTGLITNKDDIAYIQSVIEGKPLEAADMLETAFTPPQFRSIISQVFSPKLQRHSKNHEYIVSLNLKGIITSNYDSCIESAMTKIRSVNPITARGSDFAVLAEWQQGTLFGRGVPPIVHLHGVPTDPSGMIFTGVDYHRYYGLKEVSRFVEHIWTNERLLVVGFGFSDPALTAIAESNLRGIESGNRHFALIGVKGGAPMSPLIRQSFSRRLRLEPIFYRVELDKDGNEDHCALDRLLELLTTSTANSSVTDLLVSGSLAPASKSGDPVDNTLEAPISGVLDDVVRVARAEFESALFATHSGDPLFVEPRLRRVGSKDDGTEAGDESVSVADIVAAEGSFLVTAGPEYGGTTLGRKLFLETLSNGEPATLHDATQLPNYKNKLEKIFDSNGKIEKGRTAIIIDNFNIEIHERLLRELIGLGIFKRFILISPEMRGAFSPGRSVDDYPIRLEYLTVMQLDRGEIRKIAALLFDTADENLISIVVDRVYADLLALCIPLTPYNIIMYTTILLKEGDFHPLNRIHIVERYIHSTLSRPSDNYRDSFNIKNKMEVVSAFVFHLYRLNSTSFSMNDWNEFCVNYKIKSLTNFDHASLISDLILRRLFVRVSDKIYFKYRLFYSYFLGSYVANRGALLKEFMESDSYLRAYDLVEVISGCAADNSDLVLDLTEKLETAIAGLRTKYQYFAMKDLFEEVQWPVRSDDEQKLWKPMLQKLEDGPRSPQERDRIMQLPIAEERTQNQDVVIFDYEDSESKFTAYHISLIEAVKNSDSIDGNLKKRAMRAIFDGFEIIYKVGIALSPFIAKHSLYYWNGNIFYNTSQFEGAAKDDERMQAFLIMERMAPAVGRAAANAVGSRKLGEVFAAISDEVQESGFLSYLNYRSILRSKSSSWLTASEKLIRSIGRGSYYLKCMLLGTFTEFRDEINNVSDREGLKRLVAAIRAKRELGAQNPGPGLINKVLNRMKKMGDFD